MTIFWDFFRSVNALLSRLTGAAGVVVAALGLTMIASDTEPFMAVFGDETRAALALSALLSLAAVLLLPGLTRRFFHGPRRGRMLRGLLHLSAVGAVLILSGLVVKTALPPSDFAAYAAIASQAALAGLGVLALSWLAPGTGLARRAGAASMRGDLRRRQADLRNMRHRRTHGQVGA